MIHKKILKNSQKVTKNFLQKKKKTSNAFLRKDIKNLFSDKKYDKIFKNIFKYIQI